MNSEEKKSDYLREQLQRKGIQTSIHYPAVHKFSIYNKFNYNLPITNYISDNQITLPMYSLLKFEDIDNISAELIELLG